VVFGVGGGVVAAFSAGAAAGDALSLSNRAVKVETRSMDLWSFQREAYPPSIEKGQPVLITPAAPLLRGYE
jgi:hypothetical protein